MTMKLIAQEETAIYKVLTQRPQVTSRSLRSLGTWSGGGTPSKANAAFWTGGTIPWVSPKDMKVARIRDAEDRITPDAVAGSATSLVKAGAVVLVVRSGILKHSLPVAVTDVDVALNQDMKALQPAVGVEATYVAWALRANAQKILHECTKAGTTVQSIEMPALLDFEIPLPLPAEQRRVVETIEARLSLLDASVAGLHRVQANLKRYRASVLKSACEGRLVPTEAELARQEGRNFETGAQLLQRILANRRARWNSKSKYREPSAADSGELVLAAGWTWATVEQLSELVQYGSSAKTGEPSEDAVPVFRMGNIVDGEFDISKLKYLPAAHTEFPDLLLRSGDLLFNRTNSPELVGKSAVYRGTPQRASFASYLIRVRGVPEFTTEYLALVINSAFGRNWIKSVVTQQVGQANVNGSKLQELSIPLPPLAEQHRIVAEADRRLSLIRVAEAQVAANLARAQRLRQSILQAAFSDRSTTMPRM